MSKTDLQDYIGKHSKLYSEAFDRATKLSSPSESISVLTTYHEEVFSQVNCISCAACCKSAPPLLNTTDISRISKHLNISKAQFVKKYLMQDISGEYYFNATPCVFLAESNHCNIYDKRPEACRRYPHTDEEDYFFRKKMNIQNTAVCPAAATIMQKTLLKLNAL